MGRSPLIPTSPPIRLACAEHPAPSNRLATGSWTLARPLCSFSLGLRGILNRKSKRVTLIWSCPSNIEHGVAVSLRHKPRPSTQSFSQASNRPFYNPCLQIYSSNSVSPVFSNPGNRSAVMPQFQSRATTVRVTVADGMESPSGMLHKIVYFRYNPR